MADIKVVQALIDAAHKARASAEARLPDLRKEAPTISGQQLAEDYEARVKATNQRLSVRRASSPI